MSVRDKGEAGEELRVQATMVIDILPKAHSGASDEFKPVQDDHTRTQQIV